MLALLAAGTAGAAETRPRTPTPEEIAFFQAALRNSTQDVDRWAYTETTTITVRKGRRRTTTIVRFDPSKPYAEQYTALPVDGKPPSRKELRKCREKNEKREKSAKAAFARAEARANGQAPKPTVIPERTGADPAKATVAEDTAERLTFEVPVKSTRADFPTENFQFLVQLNKQTGQVEKAMMRVKKPFHMKMLVRMNAGEATAEFAVVDPAFGPVMKSISGTFGVSFLAIPVDADAVSTRTDWKRVKPFDERFSVKMAPLQMLGF